MTDEVPDRKIIKESIGLRAKHKTRREARQSLRCCEIAAHPMNRGGEPIRATRTKTLAEDILTAGYDPTEATVDSVVVEVDVDDNGNPTATFYDHFKANAGLDPDHYVDRNSLILFAGLSHNIKHLAERNIFNGMPGCTCDPPARSLDSCGCKAKSILVETGETLRYCSNKLKKADPEWFSNIVGGTEWEILSSDMDKEDPNAAHTIALAFNNKNKVALATGHLEIMRTLKSLCKPDPQTWRFLGVEYGPR